MMRIEKTNFGASPELLESGRPNSRNGYGRKTVLTDTDKIAIEVPRDRLSAGQHDRHAGGGGVLRLEALAQSGEVGQVSRLQ